MKRQNIAIPINSYSDLDKESLIHNIESRIPTGVFVNSIRSLSINRIIIPFNKINQKKNLFFKHLCVNSGYVNVEFVYTQY